LTRFHGNPSDFSTIFRSLGKRHALYGVRAEFYPFLCEAFIDTCKSTLGSLIDDRAEQDWRQLLAAIGEEMSIGAEKTVTDLPPEHSFRRRNENLDDPYLARFHVESDARLLRTKKVVRTGTERKD
jgi:hypothetical protein